MSNSKNTKEAIQDHLAQEADGAHESAGAIIRKIEEVRRMSRLRKNHPIASVPEWYLELWKKWGSSERVMSALRIEVAGLELLSERLFELAEDSRLLKSELIEDASLVLGYDPREA